MRVKANILSKWCGGHPRLRQISKNTYWCPNCGAIRTGQKQYTAWTAPLSLLPTLEKFELNVNCPNKAVRVFEVQLLPIPPEKMRNIVPTVKAVRSFLNLSLKNTVNMIKDSQVKGTSITLTSGVSRFQAIRIKKELGIKGVAVQIIEKE